MRCVTTSFFNWLGEVCKDDIKPKNVILDFELASFNCCKRFFKDSKLFGCLFHLGQIVWRRVQLMKFSKEFKNDFDVKFNVKLILALSFVPESEVLYLAACLKNYLINEELCDILRLFEWFQEEYLNFNDTNKSISFWNAYNRVIEGVKRTTNSIEGYHRHLNSL